MHSKEQIRALIFSPDPKNNRLGWLLDESQLNGSLKVELEEEYQDLMALKDWDIEDWLSTTLIVILNKDVAKLKIPYLPNLLYLEFADDGQWEELIVASCPNLKYFNCSKNKLSKLELNNCPQLETLHCQENQLKFLDVGQFSTLKQLSCSQNQLKALNIGHHANLEVLRCEDNQLETIDIDSCPNLI